MWEELHHQGEVREALDALVQRAVLAVFAIPSRTRGWGRGGVSHRGELGGARVDLVTQKLTTTTRLAKLDPLLPVVFGLAGIFLSGAVGQWCFARQS
jgi:hypothetical protein